MFALYALAAMALTNPSPKPTPTAEPLAPPAAASSARTGRTIYCIVSTITGSRIPQRDCLTRAQWLERNYDPLAPAE